MKIEPISWEDYAARPGVSNSMLKFISPPYYPQHYRARYITGEFKDEETPSKRLGKIVHRCILEPDSMRSAFHVKPEGMTFVTKEGKAWRAEHQDRPIVTQDDAQSTLCMRDAVWRHPIAKRLLKGAATEVCIFAKNEDGIDLKGRIDALPPGGNSVVDVKTVGDIGNDAIEKSIFEFRWFCQGAYYLDLLKMAGDKRDVFTFIFVEKSPPYIVTVRTLSEAIESFGRQVYRRDLAMLKQCLETNIWPGDPLDGQDVGIPAYAVSKFSQSFE